MAKLTFTGLDGYIAQLEKLRQSADGITKKALYEGAGVTAVQGITSRELRMNRRQHLQRVWALRPSNRRGTGLIRLSALQATVTSEHRSIRRDSPLR